MNEDSPKFKRIRVLLTAASLLTAAVFAQTSAASASTVELEKKVEAVATQPQVVEYTVVKGDSLSKIAAAKGSTWMRLWQKNAGVAHPDRIRPDDKLVIPSAEEVLAERPLPEVAVAPAAPAAAVAAPPAPKPQTTKVTPKPAVAAPRRAVSGNTYTPGQCTWHVKNKRPDLPNNLGNADTWYQRARAQGMATGSAPRAGAAAPRKYGMHVVYVEAVHGNGTITISEMNYNYTPYATRTRVANASDFYYIY